MNLETNFNKALRYLDSGKSDKARNILESIIIFAREESPLYFIMANCVLGELLFSLEEFEKSKICFEQVIEKEYEDDVVDYEKSIARTMVKKIEIKTADNMV